MFAVTNLKKNKVFFCLILSMSVLMLVEFAIYICPFKEGSIVEWL